MPAFLPDAEPDAEAYDATMAAAPASDRLALGEVFRDAQLASKRPLEAMFASDAEKFDRDLERMTGHSDRLAPDVVQERFGVTVDKPVTEQTAAYLSRQARERAWRDEVLSRADLNPLQTMGTALGGALLDPAGLPLIFAPELLGVRAGVEGAMAARAGGAVIKSGRLANAGRVAAGGAAEGVVGGAMFEAANYGLRRYAGEDDYTLTDSLTNVVLGGVLGAGIGGLVGAVTARGRLPGAVRGLPEESRLGAFVKAADDMAEDRPAAIGGLVEAEQARARPTPAALSALDEGGVEPLARARLLDEATAVTTRGTEIPVRYALVELDDLVTSHDDDLGRNTAFPAALQPRSRERAGAQARNHALEAELNPKRLMRETGAESGAPIVSPAGVVESGNGRTIALRRSAARDGEAWGRYRAELAAQGLDTAGMDKPVLVRMRTQAMSGEQRAGLAREMNADVTERMGAAEQAMADAARLPEAALALPDGEEAGRVVAKDFARRFIAAVAPDEANTFVTPDGALSSAGETRIRAALVARAYGDMRLVEAVFEGADSAIKTLGQALAEAAPDWARMRAGAAQGTIPAELDLTGSLRAAVDLIRYAREGRVPVAQVLAERLGQGEMFAGGAVGPETEAFLRLIFSDETLKRQRNPADIAAALRDYARRAQEVTPGPDLFGATPDASTAREILDQLAGRFARSDAAGGAEPAGLDLRAAGDVVERPRPEGLRPQGGRGAGGEGGKPDADAGGLEAPPDTSHLVALHEGLLRERQRLAVARTEAEREQRRVLVAQREREIAAEREFLGMSPEGPLPDMSDAELRAALAEPAEKGQATAPSRAQAIIDADPELKALADDTEALIAAEGLDLPAGQGAADPDIVAEAYRAAAWCLSGEGDA